MIRNSNFAMISFNGCLLSPNRVVLNLYRPSSPWQRSRQFGKARQHRKISKKAGQMISGFYQRNDYWIRYAAHNHLRVSRIIRSLALLQGEEAAKQFLARIGARVEAARLD
jgi:hypothetical protein